MKVGTETKVARTVVALNRNTLEPLVRHEGGLAVSLYMPIRFQNKKDAHEDAVHFRQLLQTAEAELLARGAGESARAVLHTAQEFAAGGVLAVKAPGVALFAASDFFRVFELPVEITEQVTVGDHFDIKPLLGLIGCGPFYVLALSQKHVRLLHATPGGLSEVEVHGAPENLFEAFEQEHFERQMQFHTAASPRVDAEATRISHGGLRETKDRVVEFLRKVDRGVTATIHDQAAPMVLAGVNYLLPMYHEVSTYPTLLQEAIPGNPDNLKAEELLAAGRAAVNRQLQAENRAHFASFQKLKGTERASSNSRHIAASADRGHVLFLFVPEGATQWGNVDTVGEVHLHSQREPSDEDLVNRAALKTLACGAHVCVMPSSDFEEGVRMAAIFRY